MTLDAVLEFGAYFSANIESELQRSKLKSVL